MGILTLAKYEEETNKKILYATILIELAGKQTKKHYFDALKTSCIIQTLAAYYALLEETQRRLNLAPQPGLSAEEILQDMKTNAIHSVEIEQLVLLENNRGSWINQLTQEYKELSRSPSLSNMDMINDASVAQHSQEDSASIPAAVNKYEKWLEQMENLCDSFRNMLSES